MNLEQRMLEAIEKQALIELNSGDEIANDNNSYAKACADVALEEIRKAYETGITHGFNNLDYDGNWYIQKQNLIEKK